jgi:hypothetical protein
VIPLIRLLDTPYHSVVLPIDPSQLDMHPSTLSLFLELVADHPPAQTTWGSRDGADDYDAERMKKRTDADRKNLKQPYYPSYFTK